MRKHVFVVLACCAAFLAAGLQGATAGSDGTVVCDQVTQTFSGTTTNLIVPQGGYCAIDNATITQNLVVQNGAGADVSESSIGYDETLGNDSGGTLSHSTVGHDVKVGFDGFMGAGPASIGHDLIATHAGSIQMGGTGPPPDVGRVTVGHDFVVNGSPGPPDPGAFVFDGICNLSVGNDLVMTNRWVTLGFSIGDATPPFSACSSSADQPVTVGHDLVVTNNRALSGFFGASSLDVGDIQVGNDATFAGNSAVPGGYLEFNDNTIAHDATCTRNTPSITGDAGDGSNHVGGVNNGCP
jgi:hypothetical protein